MRCKACNSLIASHYNDAAVHFREVRVSPNEHNPRVKVLEDLCWACRASVRAAFTESMYGMVYKDSDYADIIDTLTEIADEMQRHDNEWD